MPVGDAEETSEGESMTSNGLSRVVQLLLGDVYHEWKAAASKDAEPLGTRTGIDWK